MHTSDRTSVLRFPRLFVEGLGWNHYQAEPVGVQVDGCEYSLTPVAQKAEVVVYKFDSSQEGNIRQHQVLRKIEREAAKLSFEHVADGAISEVVSLNQPKRSCWNGVCVRFSREVVEGMIGGGLGRVC